MLFIPQLKSRQKSRNLPRRCGLKLLLPSIHRIFLNFQFVAPLFNSAPFHSPWQRFIFSENLIHISRWKTLVVCNFLRATDTPPFAWYLYWILGYVLYFWMSVMFFKNNVPICYQIMKMMSLNYHQINCMMLMISKDIACSFFWPHAQHYLCIILRHYLCIILRKSTPLFPVIFEGLIFEKRIIFLTCLCETILNSTT